jgi:pimeloyl-ACP methyl ester carboxylesterase
MAEPKSYTLEAPGAVLHYDVRGSDAPGSHAEAQPPLLLVGSPMGASGFATLAGYFPDRTVVTYDPRGAERSKRTDGAKQTTTEEQADDLHRLISALGAGPADIFGSSGGAVNALALVATHPGQVRTLVAHEPPAAQELPDHVQAMAGCEAIHETYLRDGFGPAMAKFIAFVSHDGPFPDGWADQPGPNPASFGLPTDDDGSRDDALLGLNMLTTTGYRHDFGALRAAPTRIVIGVGAQSANAVAGRAATAVAGRLGTTPVTFAGGHDGFIGGEYGRAGEPDAFAATLREVLDQPA